MSEITSQSWDLLDSIKREEGLDKAVEEIEERPMPRRINHHPSMNRKSYQPRPEPLPGELRLKEFMRMEAARKQVHITSIHAQITHGKYPGIKIRKVSRYHVFVTPP
jgi:hypothetical protein